MTPSFPPAVAPCQWHSQNNWFLSDWQAPLRIIVDHGKYHENIQVLDYLRILWIGLWSSEAYYQHHNPFERRYQTFKRTVNQTMDITGIPPELWFLCMCYVAYVINRVSDPTLNHKQPIFLATGQLANISSITAFQWLEVVYYRLDNSQYQSPFTSREKSMGTLWESQYTLDTQWPSRSGRKILDPSSTDLMWNQL